MTRTGRLAGVTVRCEPCSRHLGRHAPALAILEPLEGRWAVHVFLRWRAKELQLPPQVPDRLTRDVFSPTGAWNTAGAAQFACRRCRHRPRTRARALYALADQAAATNRQDVYV